MTETQTTVATEAAPTAAPVLPYKSEYCWLGDWDTFRIRNLNPMPNFIVRFFAKKLLGIHWRKFQA